MEGGVIVSCATSINLNLIQIHNELETNVPDCARLYYSSANKPRATHEEHKIVDHTVKCDKNCQDPSWRGQMPARKHEQTVLVPGQTIPVFLLGIKMMTRTVNITVSREETLKT